MSYALTDAHQQIVNAIQAELGSHAWTGSGESKPWLLSW